MNLFWKQGYAATSVQDLVSHLGISRASLYDTFGNKEQLFNKAFKAYRKNNLEQLCQFFQNQPDVKEGIKRFFEMGIDESICTDRKGCFVVNTTTELIPGDENILKVLEENKRSLENLFYEYLKKGEQEGQFKAKESLRTIASLMFMLYSGLKVVSKIKPDKMELMSSVNAILFLLD